MDNATTTNQGSVAGTGTWSGGLPTFGADAERGLVGNFASNGDGLDSGISGSNSGFHNQSYTASAWVNLNGTGTGGDRMIFGSESGDRLHNGIRGANIHQGHWGNDQGVAMPASMLNDEWTHVVYSHDDAANTLKIYANGVLLQTTSPRGPLNNTSNTTIAGRGDNNSWQGLLDEVGNFEDVMTDNEVLATFQLSLRPEQEASFSGQADYLGYNLAEIDQLLEEYNNPTGERIVIGDQTWIFSDTIDTTINDIGLNSGPFESHFLLLDDTLGGSQGIGLYALANPEPASLALWSILALGMLGWIRRHKAARS